MEDYSHANSILVTNAGNALWIGDLQSAQNRIWVKQNNIKTVISAATFENISFSVQVRHFKFNVLDSKSQKVLPLFDNIASIINDGLRKGSVLVHCAAGVSRSATFVIAYLIKYRNMGFLQALKYCKLQRPQVCPNLNFQRQLKIYAELQFKAQFKEVPKEKTYQIQEEGYMSMMDFKNKSVMAKNKSQIYQKQEKIADKQKPNLDLVYLFGKQQQILIKQESDQI